MTFHWKSLANDSIRTLSPYQPGKPISEVKRELAVEGEIIKLASNENPLGASPKAIAAVQASLANLALYPDASGHDLKLSIAKLWQIPPQHITLGNGSDSLFVMLGQAFVQPAQKIVVSQYCFATFIIAAHIVQAQLVIVPAKHYEHDLEATLDAVTPQTRIIFIANPNNPTGSWHNHQTIRHFLERLPPHIIVLLDEAYAEFMVDELDYPNSRELLAEFPNLIVTRTFSKFYGLAGLRVGYALSHPEIADMLNRVRLPFNVSVPALYGATAALQDEAHAHATLDNNRQGMQYLQQELMHMDITFLPPCANFITIDVKQEATTIFEALLHKGVIVRPLGPYGLPSFLRITVGTPAQNAQFITALKQVL